MINLIEQPCATSCTSACLAMLTGLDVLQVRAEFHGKYHDKEIAQMDHNPFTYLISKGFDPVLNCNPFNNQAVWGYKYLLTVPSLNLQATYHSIVLDCMETDNALLFDPARQSQGSLLYVMDPDEVREGISVLLGGFTWDLRV